MLIHFGVTPYLVFDGANLPSKAGTDSERNSRRAESRVLGLELLRLGKTSQAHQELQKAVDVTPEMAGLLIQELKRSGIKYVVAPYEADAQLAYLERTGIINGIISEDSDLLVFGARCLLTKLDQYGDCIMIRRDDFTACREISLVGWSDQDFRRMAILSGCDYLDNIGKMGLKTAYRLLRKHKTVERVLQAVRLEGKMKVPSDYLEKFIQAEMTFLYQWVFCPATNGLVNVTTSESSVKVSEMSFIGEFVQSATAAGVACGELHPTSKTPLKLPHTRDSYSNPSHSRNSQDAENMKSKKTVSIAEFFKPKRVPLAELEPNSFILTPRQQDLARRATTASWSSPIVQLSERADVRNVPRNAQITTRGNFNAPNTQTPSFPRAKRQRLCQDELSDLVTQAVPFVMDGQSKFFPRSDKRKRRHPSPEFNIHSDDSIEEALRSLPDQSITPDGHSIPVKDISQMENSQARGTNEVSEADESQITLVGINHSPALTSVLDDCDETLVEESSSTKMLFDKYLLQDIQTMRKQPLSKTSKPCRNDLNGPEEGIATQKIYATTCQVPESPIRRQSGSGQDVPDSTWPVAEDKIIVPASNASEPPSPAPARNAQSLIAHGSEDFLVSESEVDDAEYKDGSVKVPNFRQFAYNSA
jgi:exonuclease-1